MTIKFRVFVIYLKDSASFCNVVYVDQERKLLKLSFFYLHFDEKILVEIEMNNFVDTYYFITFPFLNALIDILWPLQKLADSYEKGELL